MNPDPDIILFRLRPEQAQRLAKLLDDDIPKIGDLVDRTQVVGILQAVRRGQQTHQALHGRRGP